MRADCYADAGLLLGLGGAAATGSALLPGAMAGFALGTVTAGVVTNVVLKK